MKRALLAVLLAMAATTAQAGLITGSGVVSNQEIDDWYFSVTSAGIVTINITETVFSGDGTFDSMINLRPSSGNRSRGVDDPATREAIRTLVERLVRR